MEVLTLVSRERFLDGKRIVRTPVVELLKTFQPVKRTRMIIADPREICIAVRNSFVSFHHGFDGGFAFGHQSRQFLTRRDYLFVEPDSFSIPLGMGRGRALSFAGQSFSLLGQFLEATV